MIRVLTKSSKHLWTHAPRLPCPHDACENKYPQKKDLDRHIRSHHAKWALKHPELANLSPVAERKCEHCGYNPGSRPDNLKRHMDRYNGTCAEKDE